MGITISILDQSPIYPGESPAEALAHTVQLVQKAEELGFRRFWVSEHHDSDQLAGSSPEVLISYLLAQTNRIRIGSGGVMLQHYSPYKVAENFHVLANLAPGRVDLGIGRAPGGLPRSTQALQRGRTDGAALDDKLIELSQYLEDSLEDTDPLYGLRAAPLPVVPPQLYLLGASRDSAETAARLAIPYVFSLFINGDEEAALEAIEAYRERFDRSRGREPEVILALSVFVGETKEEAEQLGGSNKIIKVHLASGRSVTLGSIESAEEYGRQSGEDYRIEEQEPYVIKGTKERVRAKLLQLHERSGIHEFIVTSNIASFSQRVRSYELLNEALSEIPAEA
ncbi:LLM class flavin-dependent oxidoreductase [Paenibacillus sp. JX-17]|uniref:LLM class flavin-dependent oxidoreductase n=1 Tax=Paenibacillus lacisoli TaxID=3064525 RepID=A0ABT9CFG7_9BACL|nr:LLM class flavin-dependent oxidoreductase [Paenibacillus sp. JX-17]MDO7908012.1 LLM class flavin-dependent oxidoreductase [Paenibacillus sp. JX-17]